MYKSRIYEETEGVSDATREEEEEEEQHHRRPDRWRISMAVRNKKRVNGEPKKAFERILITREPLLQKAICR